MGSFLRSPKHPPASNKLHSNTRVLVRKKRSSRNVEVYDPLMPGEQDDVWRARSPASIDEAPHNSAMTLTGYNNGTTTSSPQKGGKTLFVGVASAIAGFTFLIVVGVLVFFWLRGRRNRHLESVPPASAELPIQMPEDDDTPLSPRQGMSDVYRLAATAPMTSQVDGRVQVAKALRSDTVA